MKENCKPIKIGTFELKNPFLLAPLAGITDKAMRSLCAEAGASLTYTEMVSGKGLWYGDAGTERLLEVGWDNSGDSPAGSKGFPAEEAVAFQLFGSEPEIMEQAARCLCTGERMKRGEVVGTKRASRPAIIDLNAGCPVPKIVRNGEGSALLKDLDRLHDIAKAMVRGASLIGDESVPVTCKIRMGFARGQNIAVEAAKALEAAGVSAVTVHGRTREQYYDGKADWQAIADVKKAVSIPVIGNGDTKSGVDAIRMMEETGCDAVMIARGALGNPWIFREALTLWESGCSDSAEGEAFVPPTQNERIEMLTRHLDLVIADKGERIAVKEMRKHVAWYTKGMHGATTVRRVVNNIDDAQPLKRELRKLIRE